jgi:hypothetical protein
LNSYRQDDVQVKVLGSRMFYPKGEIMNGRLYKVDIFREFSGSYMCQWEWFLE